MQASIRHVMISRVQRRELPKSVTLQNQTLTPKSHIEPGLRVSGSKSTEISQTLRSVASQQVLNSGQFPSSPFVRFFLLFQNITPQTSSRHFRLMIFSRITYSGICNYVVRTDIIVAKAQDQVCTYVVSVYRQTRRFIQDGRTKQIGRRGYAQRLLYTSGDLHHPHGSSNT